MTNRRNETGTRKLFAQLSVVCVALIAAVPGFAGTSAAVFPTGLTFSPQTSGTVSVAQTATVYNIGSTPITVTGVTTSVSQFVATGTVPVTIQPSQWANFTVTFNPNLAKTFSGTLTVTITGFPSQKVTLSGVGTSTTAIASLNAKSLTFPSQTLGSASPTQAVTITNTGTTSFKVSAVTLTYPFSQTGFSGVATTIAKGKSLTMQVSFFPTASGVTNGTMSIVYDSLPPVGLSLSGTGAAPSSLAVTNYPTLPSATQNAAYQDTLTAQGGAPPYIWTLASGSLPSGLTLASSGTITGSLASSVTTGSYSFTATATDSNLATSSATLTLPVYAPTGAECNNIIFNAADGSGPLVPINDLG
ncbi:MAG: choice-of-anchor D domain-containing protein, partial [Candidatus Sulfotelmatobacter sp.]